MSGRTIELGKARLEAAKKAYTTRRVRWEDAAGLVTGVAPRRGDLVLARVAELGQHRRLEGADGRRMRLFPGDEVLVCYGDRYAPDQFEALVPGDLGPCDLVAAGGVAARARASHARMAPPTRLEPVGLVTDAEGRVLNLARYRLQSRVGARVPTLAVVGTAMNAGKTTTAAGMIHGMARAGLRVGAAKVTGTGAGGDTWFFRDAGACLALDFIDAGHVSTYRLAAGEVEDVFLTLTGALAAAGAEAIVLEVADGLFQDETAALLQCTAFARRVDGVLFAAGDAMGAVAGVQWLTEHGLPVLGVSGALTGSPLAMREAARCGVPVLDLDALAVLDWAWLVRVGPGRDLARRFAEAMLPGVACVGQ